MSEEKFRVIVRERGQYRLSDGAGEYSAVFSGRFAYEVLTPSDYPTVGDWVMAEKGADGRCVIRSLLPRSSLFLRRSAGSEQSEQAIAANIDTVLICMSLNRNFNLRRLERYLAMVWEGGAEPVVLLTKRDLCPEAELRKAEAETVAPGVSVLLCSSFEEDGTAVLAPWLEPGKTLALMGSSGVGKSTLINRLLGQELLLTDGLRNDDKGHHTTTRRQLLTLPKGCSIIDTPGMRELGMWDSDEGISATFSEFEMLANRCRFSDCTHEREKGCAVREALTEGSVSEERFRAWKKLINENAYSADSEGYLAAKEKKFKEIAKKNKTLNIKRS